MALFRRRGCICCGLITQESPEDYKKSQLYKLGQDVHLGLRTMTDVQRAYPHVKYASIRNHINKHQATTETKLVKTKVKQQERTVRKDFRDRKRHHSDVRSELIEKAMEALDEGNLKLTGTLVGQLLGQEMKIEENQKDREHDAWKFINAYTANPLPANALRHIGDSNVSGIEEGELVESDATPSPI